MAGEYQKLIDLIKRVRVNLKLRELFNGACITCFGFIALVVVIALLDYFISFGSIHRLWILYAILFALAGSVFWFIVIPLAKRITENDVALIIQKKRPEISDDLLNALQLGSGRGTTGTEGTLGKEGKEGTQGTEGTEGTDAEWVSEELIDALVEKTAVKTSAINPIDIVPFPFRKLLVPNFAVFLVFILLVIAPPHIMKTAIPRIFRPMDYARISNLMKISPGNIDILSGSKLQIEARIKEKRGRAYVNYRYEKGGWKSLRMKMEKEAEEKSVNRFLHEFESMKSDMDYFVKWNDVQSPVYRVRVITLPEIGDITLVYDFPSYTGITGKTIDNTNGDIEAIYGTTVGINARANKEIKKCFIITNDGKRFPMRIKKGTELKGKLFLSGEEEYWIEVEDIQGYTNKDPVKHRITILKDENPEVKVMAPDMDLVVSEKSVVDIVCEVKDDFGVRLLELVYQKSDVFGGEPDRIKIKKFNPAVEMKMVNYEWDLGKLKLRPGDILSYYLEASDNDVISGPNKGASRTFYIEVFSYEKEHLEIEEALADFRDRLMNLLGEQIMAKDGLEKAKAEDIAEEFRKSKETQEDIRKSARDLTELMEELFPRMENDPMGDWRTYTEYRNITDHIKLLEQGKMVRAEKEIEKAEQGKDTTERSGQADRAMKTQQEIIDELEKLALLSEDILQNRKMDDLMNSAHEMVDMQADFARALEELKDKGSKEKLEQLSKTLSEISKLMNELQKAMKDVPSELPEEFMNQDSIKNMDMSPMGDMMSELQKSIMDGDIDAALQKTRELLDSLSEMMDTLMEAASKVPSSDLESLSSQISDYMKQLDDIIKEEEDIIKETSGYDEKMLKELMKQQEKILKELAKLQKEVIERTKKMVGAAKTKLPYPPLRNKFTRNTNLSLKDMQSAYDDMVKPPARKAKEFIEKVIVKLDASRKHILTIEGNLKRAKEAKLAALLKEDENKKKDQRKREEKEKAIIDEYVKKEAALAEIVKEFDFIYDTEKEILKKLSKAEKSGRKHLSQADREKLKELAKRQAELRGKADELRQGLKKLSMKTSAIGPDILGNMQNGMSKMGEAGEALTQGDTGEAMESEQGALQYLTQGREGLKMAGQQLNGMQQQMGMGMKTGPGMPGFMQQRGGNLPGGRSGFRNSKVRIPKSEDYQVPKEFRQDIMDALKEKYPEIYKDLIKKYYKRLAE